MPKYLIVGNHMSRLSYGLNEATEGTFFVSLGRSFQARVIKGTKLEKRIVVWKFQKIRRGQRSGIDTIKYHT